MYNEQKAHTGFIHDQSIKNCEISQYHSLGIETKVEIKEYEPSVLATTPNDEFLSNEYNKNIREGYNFESKHKLQMFEHSKKRNKSHNILQGLNNSTINAKLNSSFFQYTSGVNESMMYADINSLNESMVTVPRLNCASMRVYNYFWTPRYLRTGVSSFPFDEPTVENVNCD